MKRWNYLLQLLPTTAGKEEVVDVTVGNEKENPIAVVLDQEIDALQINNATVASDIEMDVDLYEAIEDKTPRVEVTGTCCGWRVHCCSAT